MLDPRAVMIVSCDINYELVNLRTMEFDSSNSSKDDRTKCFTIKIHDGEDISKIYKSCLSNFINSKMQIYQHSRDSIVKNKQYSIKPEVVKYISKADKAFFKNARPYCQKFLNCFYDPYFDEDNNFMGYSYQTNSKEKKAREDYNNREMMETTYTIKNIKKLIISEESNHTIDDMVKNGIITEDDIPMMNSLPRVVE